MVAALLFQKAAQAKQNHIEFDQKISFPFPNYPVMSYDLIEVLSSLMDSAFESVLELPENERQVFLEMSMNTIEVLISA